MEVCGGESVAKHRPRVGDSFILVFPHHWKEEEDGLAGGKSAGSCRINSRVLP